MTEQEAKEAIRDKIRQAYQKGRFDCLDYLSGMDYGKQVYFLQDDGTVYSRNSCKYMSLDDAISEYGEELE